MPPEQMQIKAVLFDYGMVLSGPPNQNAWKAMIRCLGISEDDFRRHYWADRDDYDRGTLSSVEYWKNIGSAASTQLAPEDIDTLTAHDVELWTDINEPMLAWVHHLHTVGIRMGILSNIGDAMEAGITEKFDWVGKFYHRTWSHRLKMRKPEPGIYEAAATGLETPPENILFIDDRHENIVAAERAGMKAVQYSTHAAFEEQMHARKLQALLKPPA